MWSYRKAKKNYVMTYVNPITRHSLTRCNEQQHIYNDQCKRRTGNADTYPVKSLLSSLAQEDCLPVNIITFIC